MLLRFGDGSGEKSNMAHLGIAVPHPGSRIELWGELEQKDTQALPPEHFNWDLFGGGVQTPFIKN